MKVDILCDSHDHPIRPVLQGWIKKQNANIDVQLLDSKSELSAGTILFLISCQSILLEHELSRYQHCLVVHASDLPDGRGWSPHIWQILDGQKTLTVSLIEADEAVDEGDIWHKICIPLTGIELYDEINHKLFLTEIELMEWAIDNYASVKPVKQKGQASHYRRRTPQDSELKLDKTLGEQLSLLRVSDPNRYPAYVMIDGIKFKLTLSKDDS